MRRGNCAFRGREDGDAVYNTIRPHASLGYKPPAPETGCATPTDSAGHAGATANLKLTFHLDHSAGADHVGGGDGPSAPSAGGVATRPANFVSAETRASGSAGTEDVTGSQRVGGTAIAPDSQIGQQNAWPGRIDFNLLAQFADDDAHNNLMLGTHTRAAGLEDPVFEGPGAVERVVER